MIKTKKKFADMVKDMENVIKIEQSLKSIDNEDFKGDIHLNHFIEISEPFVLDKGLCIQDTEYKWLEFYDYTAKYRLTAIYDGKNEIVEWYFDISREIGKENGMPFEDDMYLDVVLTPGGDVILLDEDELKEALENGNITKEDFIEAYETANSLIKKIKGKSKELKKFTDMYLNMMLGDEK